MSDTTERTCETPTYIDGDTPVSCVEAGKPKDAWCSVCRGTERTCETCGTSCINQGTKPHGLVAYGKGDGSDCRDFSNRPAAQDSEPWPRIQDTPEWKAGVSAADADQDADTLQPAIDKALSYFEKLSSSGQTIQIDGPEYHGLILWSTWNHRPSLPMSAEVEKAIETIRGHLPSSETCEAFDIIVAALKEKV
jgi:hypothetical protein